MTPTEIKEAVKEEFGIDMDREHVRAYNPDQRDVADKWKTLFQEARAKFLADVSSIGIAHQPYRLAELQKLYHAAGRNSGLKRELLEQAAKEVGGAFTNRRELTGKDGGPFKTEDVTRNAQFESFVKGAEAELVIYMKKHKVGREAALKEWEKKNPGTVRHLRAAAH